MDEKTQEEIDQENFDKLPPDKKRVVENARQIDGDTDISMRDPSWPPITQEEADKLNSPKPPPQDAGEQATEVTEKAKSEGAEPPGVMPVSPLDEDPPNDPKPKAAEKPENITIKKKQ